MISSLFNYTLGLLSGSPAGAGTVRTLGSPVRDDATPLEEADFVVFDTELTGLNPKKESIVSIGAVRMQGRKILLGETFYRVVEPRTALTGASVVIHGITPSEAAGSPGIDALLPEFLGFCGEAVVAGHVVSIDLMFLNKEVRQLYGNNFRNPAVDTARIHQWIRKEEEDVCAYHGGLPEANDLFALAKKYEIPVQQAHNAVSDAFVAAQLLQRLLHEAPRWGITTVKDLLRIGEP